MPPKARPPPEKRNTVHMDSIWTDAVKRERAMKRQWERTYGVKLSTIKTPIEIPKPPSRPLADTHRYKPTPINWDISDNPERNLFASSDSTRTKSSLNPVQLF